VKLVGAGICAAVFVAIAFGDPVELTFTRKAALTTIDTVPSSQDLTHATLTVPDDLIVIAETADGTYEPGVRLRAVRGLAVYCTTQGNSCPPGPGTVHDTLTALIDANETAHSGAELLLLRAAIESVGPLKVTDDYFILKGLLDHPSRDIRAATARALAQLCDTRAINDLRVRYQNESTDQVKLAISAALRTLPCPVN
jgi:hypothetical protein